MKDKTIYDLELHESMEVKTGPVNWEVTRVASGWLYQDNNPNRTTVSEFFVPYSNRFKPEQEFDVM